ncbi:MAG TPA: hypothetical protein VFQ44_06695 [Streptosporangiaceae bacterium]|nr:hypothetical protein [Streptosporangiaceae bacterium]
MKQPIPEPARLPVGGKLRFALGAPGGPRSNVWTVFGSKNTSDVYVGARDTLTSAKLSLHQSGRWRRALTPQEVRRQNMPEDADRVLNRWEVPQPIADGWIHAVSITIPCSSIQANPGPWKPLKSGAVSFYLADPGPHNIRFDILIKAAGAPMLTVENITALIGRIELPAGGCVWVYATEFAATDSRAEEEIINLRAQSRRTYIEQMGLEAFRQYQNPVGIAWGFSDDDRRPVVIDLGDLRSFDSST